MTEREKERKRLIEELIFYLENYNELTRTRPSYKKVVDKEIAQLTEQIKTLSR